MFAEMIARQHLGMKSLARVVAERAGLHYDEYRDGERLIEKRHDGQWVTSDDGSLSWDDGLVWTQDNYPHTYNKPPEALSLVTRPLSIWYHGRTMCLVILDLTGRQIGVPSNHLRSPLGGTRKEALDRLIDGLAAKLLAVGEC